MICSLCGSKNYDGAVDNIGDFICVDCWADGSARKKGRIAETFVPANTYYAVNYPQEMKQRIIDAYNKGATPNDKQ